MDSPGSVIARLEAIEEDLANRQNAFESAARAWVIAKRDKEKAHAVAFIAAEGTVAERQAAATEKTSLDGKREEAEYEAIKAVVRVLEARASIGQSILRSQSRQMVGV